MAGPIGAAGCGGSCDDFNGGDGFGAAVADATIARAAGAAGFGLGSSLYRPGDDAATVRMKAGAIVAAWAKPEE